MTCLVAPIILCAPNGNEKSSKASKTHKERSSPKVGESSSALDVSEEKRGFDEARRSKAKEIFEERKGPLSFWIEACLHSCG
jgi:hypothetical protein